MISTTPTPPKPAPHRARANPYRPRGRHPASSDYPVPTMVHDVPLPNGLLAMQVVVTRLTDMPGWSKVATTWDDTCRISPDDFDEQERYAPWEVMRASLRIALHLLPPGQDRPISASVYGAFPLPDRLADFAARAMVDALATSCADCFHRRTRDSIA